MKTAVLILPTYNESGNIVTLIEAIEGVFPNITGYQFHILVVDDYSPDGTAELVERLNKKHKNITILSKKKEGLGAAYIFGMRYALKHFNPEMLIQMDADWSHNPHLLPQFVQKIEQGADLVVGSRYIAGGSIPGNWGIHRKIYSIVGNTFVRLGLGMLSPHDWTSGYRMYTREVFEKVQSGLEKYSGYTFQVAFLHRVKMFGFTIAEVPLKFIDRTRGKSKIAPSEYIKNLLLYVVGNSTFIKYLIIGVVGFLVQSLVSKMFIAFGLFPGLAVSVGAFLAIICNFLGNNLWTFSHRRIQGTIELFNKFIHFSFHVGFGVFVTMQKQNYVIVGNLGGVFIVWSQ
ncbi:MAG: glycosyltransferase [Patescibacteria group bacterium]